jgi:hypothetical protein
MNRAVHTPRAALCMAAALWSIAAPAQDTAPIFKGKTVDIYKTPPELTKRLADMLR